MKHVTSAKETLNSLQQGALSRTTASTNMNAQSSRSHAIFTLHITQQRVVKLNDDETMSNGVQGQNFEYEMLTAKFNFVDLAGSERLKRTGATGDRAKEGISINCGLLALGNVISALGDKAKRGSHVPYRDSKLTRLLQDSLGGNSRTLMIACVSPSDRDFMETLNTLKYANRARNIKNKVVVNQDKASKQIATLRSEIQTLMMELNEYKQGKRVAGEGEAHMSDMYHENTMLQTENDKLRMRIKALNHTVDEQKKRITEYVANKSIALLNGELKGGVEELIAGYVEEIEELRSRLLESEAMSAVVARRSVATALRMGRASIEAPTESILELAKQDLNTKMRKAKELKNMVVEDKKPEVLDLGSDGEKESGDESQSEEDDDTQNEMQLKGLTRDLDELKKTKVKLMRQMKEEIAKNKKREAERERQISQLKKESRKREIQIKNMESEKRQRELVLKRKQEEVKQLRQQHKPISGKLGKQRKLNPAPPGPEPPLSSTATMVVSGTGVEVQPVDRSERVNGLARNARGSSIPTTSRVTGKAAPSPRKRLSASQVKKTWETIEKRIERIVAHDQTVSTMESDMDRWIKDRDMLSKKIEKCNNKLAETTDDDNATRDLNEQLDALKAHLDYVQDNITEAQTEIVDLEEGGETTEITEVITKCSTHEARLLMEHFLNKTIELSKETVSKDATVKELETKLEALRQHSELQQDLVMNLLQYPSKDDPAITSKDPKDPEVMVNGGPEMKNGMIADDIVPFMSKSEFMAFMKDDILPNTNKINTQASAKEKARRRSSTQNELLYPVRHEKRESTLSSILDVPEEPALPLINTQVTPSDPINTTDLKQKLLQLERARKAMDKNDSTLMPPPVVKVPVSTPSIPPDRPQSVAGSTSSSFVRGSFKSKSARNFARPKAPLSSVSVTSSTESRSQPTSPTPQRKSFDEKGKLGNGQNDAEDVFSRLTSTLPQDANPNAGRMLPVKPPMGKPGALVCVYASTGHNSAVLSLCVSQSTMFSGSKDRTVKIWDLNTGEETMSLGQHKRDVTSLKYCAETKRLFSVSQNIIKIWDIRSPPAKCIKSITSGGVTSDSSINDLTVNHSGTHVFAANGNTVKIWDLNNYQMIGKLGGHAGHVMALLLLGIEEPYLMLTGSRDHYIKMFELSGTLSGIQTPIQTFEPPHYDGVQSLALQGNNLFSGSRDNSIKKWNLSTQQVQQNLISAHKDWVCSLDFLCSHNVLLSGCRGGVLKLWEPETCQEIGEIKAHRHPINAIATNSSFVFTASSDRLIRVWKATEILDEQLSQMNHNRR
ncbi:Kinesin KIF21A [Paramuricea clavata]|uniref:Kinesin KIF21A n=2 Tax=Paramuricea clavata TaxID=317549 RepID=A0A7D9HTP0_PARCT|nr:Kinesin KIF21A [Paramuricea clavata]